MGFSIYSYAFSPLSGLFLAYFTSSRLMAYETVEACLVATSIPYFSSLSPLCDPVLHPGDEQGATRR